MADTNWWDEYNNSLYAMRAQNPNGYVAEMPARSGVSGRPSDKNLNEFRAATGKDYVGIQDYNNWDSINSRNNLLSNFVDRMASGDPVSSANSSRISNDLANYGGRLNSYFDTAAPTASTSNRFEAGLGDAETRLRNLLDNPDSINQSAAYKFRVGQGEEALQRSLGAKGMLNSGNRLMELTKYGQDMGSQEYDAQAGRLNSLLGNYSQSWLGDKNANTQRYLAESQAWNQRGGLLKDIYVNMTTAANQNQQIESDNRVKWAEVGKGLMPAAPTRSGGTTFWNMVK